MKSTDHVVLCLICSFAAAWGAARAADSPAAPTRVANLKFEGEGWTYEAAGQTITGYLLKPDGAGSFPAVIINQGKGGRPEGFSLGWAREMVKWGLVCICPTLTHVAGTTIQGQDGASAENIARVDDSFAILAGLGYVDLMRVAVIGHSMGSFVTIGYCGTAGTKVKAAAISAGGVATRPDVPMPSVDLASRITAPILILHGTVDGAVAAASSAQLQEILDQHKVANRRVLFEGTNHDLPTNSATRGAVLALIREWFATHGVLPFGANTPPTLSLPADQTVKTGTPVKPLTFTIGDCESKPGDLTVTVASSYPRLLPAANIALTGSGAERTLTAAPLADQAGRTTILVTVSDGTLMTTRSFVLGVADATGVVPAPVVDRRGPGRRGAPPAR